MKNYIYSFLFLLTLSSHAQEFITEDGLTDFTCSGILYAPGGTSGGVLANTDVTYSICPELGEDLRSALDFTSFNFPIGLPGGSFIIYDSDQVDENAIIYNSSSEINPGFIQASDSNLTGCLTIRILTNSIAGFSPAYAANISCEEPCQNIVSSITTITPAEIINGDFVVYFNTLLALTADGVFGDGNSDGATYLWDFGDGDFATGNTVSHLYTALGAFQIKLTIVDANGCLSNISIQNIIVAFDEDVTGVGCPSVVLPNIIELGCSYSGEAITVLTADFFDTGNTDQYAVSEIDYAPPFPFFGGSFVNVTADDDWSPLIDLGFDFVFFENTYQNAIVTDNGAVSFHIEGISELGSYIPGGESGFSFFQQIPINPGASGPPYLDAILGVLQDLNPLPVDSPANASINFQVLGEEPCRALVFNLFNLGHFQCGTDNGAQTSQIVLYETTNAIEVYVNQRTPCSLANAGSGTIGIQNSTGTIGYAPPGRNTGAWSASDEAWRFTPNGESIVTITWFDENDNLLGQGPELFVTPQMFNFDVDITDTQEAIITVVANYSINGDVEDDIIVEDTAIIRFRQDFSVEIEEAYVACSTTGVELELILDFFESGLTEEDVTIEWFLDGTLIENETESTYLALETGQYSSIVSSENCSINVITNVEVFEPPNLVNPDDVIIQTQSLDDIFFDLTIYDLDFFGLDPAIFSVVEYYELELDAENQTNPILTPENYEILNEFQTIFIGVNYIDEALNANCGIIINFNISVLVLFPEPADLINCALPGDIFAVFDLTDNEELIYGDNNPDDFTINYFDNEDDWLVNQNPLDDLVNYLANEVNQNIYVTIFGTENPEFFDSSQFQIISFRTPVITEIVNVSVCGDFSPTQVLDLSSTENDIFGGPNTNNWDLDFFASEADAINNQNAIVDPIIIIDQGQTIIYYNASNPDAPACFSIGNLNILVNDVEIANSPADIKRCDDGSENQITFFDLSLNNPLVFGANQTPENYTINYFLSFDDANGNVNPILEPTAFLNTTSSSQEIWIRITHDNDPSCFVLDNFFIETTLAAEVNLILDQLEACDGNNDGFFSGFDLESRIEDVNFLNNPDVLVSFHPTNIDAETGQNPLSSPYANVVEDQQTIFVRVFDGNNGCVQNTSFDLLIYNSPLLEETVLFVACDTEETGSQFFDLTSIEEELFVPDQDTTDFEISYHVSEEAANSNTGLIGNPTAYQNQTNPQTVYARVVDPNSPLRCFSIVSIELIVNPIPEITPPTLIAECDDLESGSQLDEQSSFDLTQKISEITIGIDDFDVVFYESEEDQANNNPIPNIFAYQNIVNPQTIEVSVFSLDNDCAATTNLTLVVDPLPTIPAPEPLIVCDADNEGTSEFDLLAAIDIILDGEVNTQITFHFTEITANNGDSPIAIEDENGNSILFQNTNPFSQTLYIRAVNIGDANINGTGCFAIRPLELQVEESPRIDDLEDLVICDDETLNGFAAFNLVENTANAIGIVDPVNFVVTYHEIQTDAEEGINAIAVPSNYTNITNPQTIYVRFLDAETGCTDIFGFAGDNSFTITVEPYPDLSTPTPLEVCNTSANPDVTFPTGIFDLASKEEELTGLTPVPANISFTYYENENDLINQENAIEDPTEFINSTNPPMLIYVEATNTITENQCTNINTITIKVLPVPLAVDLTQEQRRLTACDDDNDGISADPFDLTQIGQQIIGSENNLGGYYLSEDAAINEDAIEQILDPTAYVNDPMLNELDENFFPTNTQIIWVRLGSNADGNFCFTIVKIELIVEPNPEINPAGNPFGFTLCEGDPTQLPIAEEIVFSLYDANNGDPSEIIPVLDPSNENQDIADFEYTFHLSEIEAEEGINVLAAGYQAANGQILYLRVTHILTGCYNIGNIAQIQITIEPRPAITNTELNPIIVCADEQLDDAAQVENQQVATIDLTQRDQEIDPNFEDPDGNTTVEYYASQEDIDNGIAIEDPVNFTTTTTPITIVAVVVDLDNFCSSLSTQSFEIQVNPIPLVDITDWDGAIVCINPQTGEVIETDFSPPILDTGLSEDNYTFEWTLDGIPIAFTGSVYSVPVAGNYTVTVTDMTNNLSSCQASSSAEIVQSNGPTFVVNVLSQAFDGSQSIEIANIEGDGDYEFSVDNGPWISLGENELSIIFSNLDAGERIVRGRDIGGCGEVVVSVFLIDYPRFFTPNEDGYNDTWNIIGLANQQDAKIYIFDRYGKLLKQLSPSSLGWDGTYNGKAMSGSDYWFSVQYDEPSTGARKEFKANFTLKR